MTAETFSGTWNLDSDSSDMKSSPAEWRQVIRVKGNSVSVREEILRQSGKAVVEVTGALDGKFYPVQGSPLVEEIAYIFESGCIQGTGRKQGAVVLREVVSLLDQDTMNLALTIYVGGKELPLANAVFRRA
jgi:hypothetical protein